MRGRVNHMEEANQISASLMLLNENATLKKILFYLMIILFYFNDNSIFTKCNTQEMLLNLSYYGMIGLTRNFILIT